MGRIFLYLWVNFKGKIIKFRFKNFNFKIIFMFFFFGSDLVWVCDYFCGSFFFSFIVCFVE